MINSRSRVHLKAGGHQGRRRATSLAAGLLTLAAALSTATPAAATPPSAAFADTPVGFTASAAMPPEPGSPLPQRIAQFAVGQIGAQERGDNLYPKRYQNINRKHIQRPASWCGVFVNWAWAKAGVTQRPSMNPARGSAQGHWATYWQKWGKEHHRWKPISKRNPWKGDVVVYGNYPESGHVGIVVDVKYDRDGKVTHVRTVEGNISDKVTDLGWRQITELTGNGLKATGFVSPI